MKTLVTGARGLLGTEVVAAASERGHEVVALGHDDLDVTDAVAVGRTLEVARPDVVVHCAAYTQVDRSEEEPVAAMGLNRDATRHVAEATRAVGGRMLYVSSDYVFDGSGDRPYLPDDAPAPISVYGASKLAGEAVCREADPDALIVRTSWLYGGGGRNFVTTMIELAGSRERLTVVDDQVGSPSWTYNVAAVMAELLERGARGIWHVTDRGPCTWADLARATLRMAGYDTEVVGITTDEFGALAPRPRFSQLDVSATEALLGHPMTPWGEALAAFLSGRRERAGSD